MKFTSSATAGARRAVLTSDNLVHDNTIGIASSNSGLISDNRVWHSNIGILMDGATVSGNRVYSNSIGIQTTNNYVFSGQTLNNLNYATTNDDVDLRGPAGSPLANNTIYQPVGDANRAARDSNGTRPRTYPVRRRRLRHQRHPR